MTTPTTRNEPTPADGARVEGLLALADKATAPPWLAKQDPDEPDSWAVATTEPAWQGFYDLGVMLERDARLVAAAREALPAVCRELLAAWEEIATLRASLDLAHRLHASIHAELLRRAVELEEERDRLLAQLPDGMKHCTIVFKSCEKGHGWLTATNWIDHGCPTCERDRLREALRATLRWCPGCLGRGVVEGTPSQASYVPCPTCAEARQALGKEEG